MLGEDEFDAAILPVIHLVGVGYDGLGTAHARRRDAGWVDAEGDENSLDRLRPRRGEDHEFVLFLRRPAHVDGMPDYLDIVVAELAQGILEPRENLGVPEPGDARVGDELGLVGKEDEAREVELEVVARLDQVDADRDVALALARLAENGSRSEGVAIALFRGYELSPCRSCRPMGWAGAVLLSL